MPDGISKGGMPVRSHKPNQTVFSFRFTTNGGSDPSAANTVDPDSALAVAITRTATGTYLCTLRRKYRGIDATATAGGTAGTQCTTTEAASPTATNTITVLTYLGSGTSAADTTGIPIKVSVHCYTKLTA